MGLEGGVGAWGIVHACAGKESPVAPLGDGGWVVAVYCGRLRL